MANTNFSALNDKNLEQCVVTFIEKVESMEKDKTQVIKKNLPPAQVEMRTLQLWRSVISECLASFLYVFIVCGAASTAAQAGSLPLTVFITAAASGFTVCVLTYCFQNLSGAHMNPSITVSMMMSQRITLFRGMLFIVAQSGGAIAGAALLYGVSVTPHVGDYNAAVPSLASHMSVWKRLGIEFVLSFLIVFTYRITVDDHRKWFGNSATCMGLAYLATGLVSQPTQNPIRAFGPAFVTNRWDNQWVFWGGPCLGGVAADLVFRVIFITNRRKSRSEMSVDGDSASIHSEADTYDDLGKGRGTAMKIMNPNPYTRQLPTNSGNGHPYNTGFYPMSVCKPQDRSESIYEGSRSLYTRSPPLTRANLSRSQSVYTKTPPAHNYQREQPRPGPLYPAQSMYPMPSSNANPISQNHQNQQRQGTENIYGTKTSSRDIYGKIPGRNESIYGGVVKKHHDSNDNSYNSYISNNTSGSKITPTHMGGRKESYPSSAIPPPPNGHSSYYHHSQPSPNSQLSSQY
ncbi:neurogenic protein big brain-like [Planococcus citri]|uniref:neurogenic protein big brain-like n=1 Tax=Planococcus citri TaxID=170843 RepID=UPI0031FA4108